MVISEIQSLYRDENDLFRTVIKRIYEEQVGDKWGCQEGRNHLRGRGACSTA